MQSALDLNKADAEKLSLDMVALKKLHEKTVDEKVKVKLSQMHVETYPRPNLAHYGSFIAPELTRLVIVSKLPTCSKGIPKGLSPAMIKPVLMP